MSRRQNEEWITELSGSAGWEKQQAAHQDLANYLYVVLFNYLRYRREQANPILLASTTDEEMSYLAEDIVQEVLVKIMQDDCILLTEKFRGDSRFTTYIATVARHEAGSELRQRRWQNLPAPAISDTDEADEDLGTFSLTLESKELPPENEVLLEDVLACVQSCLATLPERRAMAFICCQVQEMPSKEVAIQMKTTVTAVNLLVYHAKRKLRHCLQQHGYDRNILQLFNGVIS